MFNNPNPLDVTSPFNDVPYQDNADLFYPRKFDDRNLINPEIVTQVPKHQNVTADFRSTSLTINTPTTLVFNDEVDEYVVYVVATGTWGLNVTLGNTDNPERRVLMQNTSIQAPVMITLPATDKYVTLVSTVNTLLVMVIGCKGWKFRLT